MAADDFSASLIKSAGYTDARFPPAYDAYRPSPPGALADLLCLVAGVQRPRLVVDLGSGTGLSTRVWADRADEVVGVEASAEMLGHAEMQTVAGNVRYVAAFAHETGLPTAAADIVTCSQSFHWMEPEPTLAEVARILRPGGVFAAYDCDWPPVCHWEVERAFEEVLGTVGRLRAGGNRYEKSGHLERMGASGHFRHVREIGLHSRVRGSADRIVGIAFSLGPLAVLLEGGVGEDELGLTHLRETAHRVFGDAELEWFMSYRVRLAVR